MLRPLDSLRLALVLALFACAPGCIGGPQPEPPNNPGGGADASGAFSDGSVADADGGGGGGARDAGAAADAGGPALDGGASPGADYGQADEDFDRSNPPGEADPVTVPAPPPIELGLPLSPLPLTDAGVDGPDATTPP